MITINTFEFHSDKTKTSALGRKPSGNISLRSLSLSLSAVNGNIKLVTRRGWVRGWVWWRWVLGETEGRVKRGRVVGRSRAAVAACHDRGRRRRDRCRSVAASVVQYIRAGSRCQTSIVVAVGGTVFTRGGNSGVACGVLDQTAARRDLSVSVRRLSTLTRAMCSKCSDCCQRKKRRGRRKSRDSDSPAYDNEDEEDDFSDSGLFFVVVYCIVVLSSGPRHPSTRTTHRRPSHPVPFARVWRTAPTNAARLLRFVGNLSAAADGVTI